MTFSARLTQQHGRAQWPGGHASASSSQAVLAPPHETSAGGAVPGILLSFAAVDLTCFVGCLHPNASHCSFVNAEEHRVRASEVNVSCLAVWECNEVLAPWGGGRCSACAAHLRGRPRSPRCAPRGSPCAHHRRAPSPSRFERVFDSSDRERTQCRVRRRPGDSATVLGRALRAA